MSLHRARVHRGASPDDAIAVKSVVGSQGFLAGAGTVAAEEPAEDEAEPTAGDAVYDAVD